MFQLTSHHSDFAERVQINTFEYSYLTITFHGSIFEYSYLEEQQHHVDKEGKCESNQLEPVEVSCQHTLQITNNQVSLSKESHCIGRCTTECAL